jgi:hypothetical protein
VLTVESSVRVVYRYLHAYSETYVLDLTGRFIIYYAAKIQSQCTLYIILLLANSNYLIVAFNLVVYTYYNFLFIMFPSNRD